MFYQHFAVTFPKSLHAGLRLRLQLKELSHAPPFPFIFLNIITLYYTDIITYKGQGFPNHWANSRDFFRFASLTDFLSQSSNM